MQRSGLYPRYTDNAVLIILAILLGTATALAVLLFREAVDAAHTFFNITLGGRSPLALLLTLPLAGFIVGLIMHYIVGPEKYRGVAALMESVALAGGRLPYRLAPFKALAAALSLGAGASLGRQDPSVHIGANIGSWLGAKLHLPDENRNLLVAAGAASAISSAFNAPIAGVFFALEIVLGEFTTTAFGAVVLASVVGAAVTQSFVGANPVFGGLEYTLGHSGIQLPFFILLGLLLAGVSIVMIRHLSWQQSVWQERITIWPPLRTALVGVMIAGVGLFLPEILGPGNDFMRNVLIGDTEHTIFMLLVIGVVKMVMTGLSIGGGFVGGVFAPTLFIGIVLGSAYGRIVNGLISSQLIGDPQVYAIAGMAGLLAGVARAPMTAVLLVFELTDDYTLILPIMLTAVICTLIIEQTGPPGIYMLSLVKHGLHLQRGRDVDLMQGLVVREAMLAPPPVIAESATMADLRASFHAQNTRALCVVGEAGKLVGIVTLGDLQRKYQEIADHENAIDETMMISVLAICTREVITVGPEDVLWTAIRRMGEHDIGRLPVVDHDKRPIGLLRRHDIMRAYNTAVARKFHDQHYAGQIRLNTLTGAEVLEYTVYRDSPVHGMMIQDISLPHEALIASVARRGKLIIPHGDTTLREHDRVTVVTDIAAEPTLERLFGHQQPERHT